jgi:hypothetical protein
LLYLRDIQELARSPRLKLIYGIEKNSALFVVKRVVWYGPDIRFHLVLLWRAFVVQVRRRRCHPRRYLFTFERWLKHIVIIGLDRRVWCDRGVPQAMSLERLGRCEDASLKERIRRMRPRCRITGRCKSHDERKEKVS